MTATVIVFLATYLMHSTLLLGVAWAATRWLVRTEAWRETIWKAALVGGLATTVLAQTAPLTRVRVSLPDAMSTSGSAPVSSSAGVADPYGEAAGSRERDALSSSGARTRASRASGDGASQGVEAALDEPVQDASVAIAPAPVATPRRVSASAAAAALWAAFALLLLVRFAWRHVRLRIVLRGRRVVTEPGPLSLLAELRRMAGVWLPVNLTSTPSIASPLVFGRREICVPDRFLTELGRDEQRAALAHELGHLARRDPAWLFAATLLESIFFFQPLHRTARRQLRETAEYRADGWAVRVAGGRLSLARCLAEVATWVAPGPQPALAERVAMAEGGSPLLSRVRRLLERQPEPEPRAGLRIAVGLALIAGTALFAPAVALIDGEPAAPAEAEHPTDAENRVADVEADADVGADTDGVARPDSTTQDTLEVLRFDGPAREGSGFIARLNEAGRDARQRPHWIAYAFSATSSVGHMMIDSEGSSLRFSGTGPATMRGTGIARRLGVESATAGRLVLLVQLTPAGAATRVDRIRLVSPDLPADVAGRVYWLGVAESEESLRWLRDIYTATRSERIRRTAVDAIAVHPTSSAEAFLLHVIDEGSSRAVREQAVEGLAFHPTDQTLRTLTQIAQSDGDERIAREATETLAELDHRDAGSVLRTLVRDRRRGVREQALEGMVERRDTSIASLLIDIALNDPDPSMRREAIEYMEELPASVAVPLLRRVVLESDDPRAARQAVETLGDIGSMAALGAIEDAIAHALAEGVAFQTVAFQAVESIADFDDRSAVPLLERLATDYPSERVRREAMEELLDRNVALLDGAKLVDIALNDASSGIRREAVERIADLPSMNAVPLLRRVVFESRDASARREAVELLGDFGTMDALEVLDEIIARNLDDEASFQAVESIADNFPRDAALPRLAKIAREHPSDRVRREALDRLRDLGGDPGSSP